MFLKTLQSDSFVITVSYKNNKYKIFRIDFGFDGSIYISFPYYKNSEGIVARVVMPSSVNGQYKSLSLSENGKCTSNLVKYSHHTSGEALFSLTGKVKTEIRKQSVPLSLLNGHIFTLMAQGLENFDKVTLKKDINGWSEKRTVINFDLKEDNVGSIKFVGIWQSFENFASGKINYNEEIDFVGPQFCYNSKKQEFGFMLSPRANNIFNKYILSLRAGIEPVLDKDGNTVVGLIGGFDDVNKVNNLNEESSFLSMMYPYDKSSDDYLKKLGSIDIIN